MAHFGIWGANGLEGITAPLLLISGDHDLTVDYTDRRSRIFRPGDTVESLPADVSQGGHALGLGRGATRDAQSLWDQDWFEDPVWRKDRLIGISLHFITAFLDRYVKDDASRGAYSMGSWWSRARAVGSPAADPWGAYSPGGQGVTLWKGFQRRHATGMSLMHREANAPAR